MPEPTARPPAAGAPPERWRFGPAEQPILVENAEAVLPYLPYFLAGWDIRWAGDGGSDAADIRVTETGDGAFRVVSHGTGGADFTFDNPYDAANGLAGALISLLVAGRPDTVCLHAGAAEVDGGLVVAVGDSFAGKSSIALHLAVLGHRFFGDDQIAVTLGDAPQGECLGLMPKVRLPLPPDCGDAYREFVEAYTAMDGEGMVYLKLWDREAAVFGERRPVRALVFLDRRADGRAEPVLAPASRPELVRTLVTTAFAPHIASTALVSRLTAFADAVDSYRLTYASSREAAAVLSGAFGRMPPR